MNAINPPPVPSAKAPLSHGLVLRVRNPAAAKLIVSAVAAALVAVVNVVAPQYNAIAMNVAALLTGGAYLNLVQS